MKLTEEKKTHLKKEILTIPNLITLIRFLLIPIVAYLYLAEENLWAALLLAISGASDLADGYIARRFDQVSDLGKAIDPIADKATQIVTLAAVAINYPLILIPCTLLLIKEVISGVLSLAAIKRSGKVVGAEWHGKLASLLVYIMTTVHFLFYSLPLWVTVSSVVVTGGVLLLSFALYAARHIKYIRGK